jgi:hypothetical protein
VSSKQAFILAMLLGAIALLTCLLAFLSLAFLQAAQDYLPISRTRSDNYTANQPPNVMSRLQGSHVDLVELDKHGQIVRTIYRSDLEDQVADFSLLAVPQKNYQGYIFVQSRQDLESDLIIVYPLDVATGKILPASLNTSGQAALPSPLQDVVAVVNTTKTVTDITFYDLATGTELKTWSAPAGTEYRHWTTATCFEGTYCLGS